MHDGGLADDVVVEKGIETGEGRALEECFKREKRKGMS